MDATAARGLDAKLAGTGAIVADVDNDTKPDLVVLSASGPRLWHNDGARFSDATAAAGLASAGAATAGALVDADHDGDLDLVLGGSGTLAHRLFQNDGAAHFKDVSATAGVAAAPATGLAIVPTDFDNRRDIDLLFAGAEARAALPERPRRHVPRRGRARSAWARCPPPSAWPRATLTRTTSPTSSSRSRAGRPASR